MKKLACLSILLGFCAGSFAQSPSPSSTPSAPTPAASPAPAKPYPLKTCLVSGEKLEGAGSMGEPYKFDYKGQQIVLCCKSCLKKFNKEPEKYLKKLERAEPK